MLVIEPIVCLTGVDTFTSSQWYVDSCSEGSADLFADCSHVIKVDLRQASGALRITFRSKCNRLYLRSARAAYRAWIVERSKASGTLRILVSDSSESHSTSSDSTRS